jgi:hypothetical protein
VARIPAEQLPEGFVFGLYQCESGRRIMVRWHAAKREGVAKRVQPNGNPGVLNGLNPALKAVLGGKAKLLARYCTSCGRTIWAEESVAKMMGPVCREHERSAG